jgi:hypothetical protein
MTDRELLEAAAKAIGLTLDFDNAQWGRPWANKCGYWNPLTDDGDALRLAVKLQLFIDLHGKYTRVSWPFEPPKVVEPHEADPYAATRRAIVRAAAEIAKATGEGA